MNNFSGLHASKFSPLIVVGTFWCITFLVYFFDLVIEYPSKNDFLLLLFFFSSLISGVCGYLAAASIKIRMAKKVACRQYAIVGFLAYVGLFYPIVNVYTGNNLTDFFALLLSPLDAYQSMHEMVSGDRMERAWLIILKIILSPFILFSLPYFAMRYINENKDKKYFVILVFLYFAMSVFRGTDKEIFDTFIIVFSVFLACRPNMVFKLFYKVKYLKYFLIFILFVSLIVFEFYHKKSDRLGDVESRCFSSTDICYEVDSGDPINFVTSLLSSYLTQGYYGLASSFDGDFNSSWGLGHSKSLEYLGSLAGISKSENLVRQLDSLGWSSKGHWSSGFVWMANDVPYAIIPIIIFFIFFWMGYSFIAFYKHGDVFSLVVFSYFFHILIYMPANLQLAQTGDLYIGFIFIFAIYLLRFVVNFSSVRNVKI
ncbi:hypothetical protein [Halomonas sp. 11-S5]|uniref:hypothetical protein n=1 Tax=Halomonas sp. 11-S5 TaxID=2994064 RepID=UPI0024684056|nr:hypothetical protein [Halomonas sp. 11-S5]